MKKYKYIIIGGGMTGAAAVMGIRENDPDGSIAVFSKEEFPPYSRPPLSKGLWAGKDEKGIFRKLDELDVDLILDTTVEKISPDEKLVVTKKGKKYSYQKLLLATGGDPRHMPGAPDDVIYYRTLDDYHKLKKETELKDNFCIIGGGFIGSELAAALTNNNKQVTMLFPEKGLSGTIFPENLSEYMAQYYRDKGVKVFTSHLVDSIVKEGDQFVVKYHSMENNEPGEAYFDAVIAGIGIIPNTALAEDSGITVDNGIVVDEYLQTNHPDIFAAGDVANFLHIPLGQRMRLEHASNAHLMGLLAGKNMSGENLPYDNFPYFYSDLFDMGYEAIGDTNKRLDIFEDWIDPFKKGTIFYLNEGRIRGLIFWNLWDKVEQGKEVISSGKVFHTADLPGLFR
jgi:NADPH-dependent 2,4-dienoyl-CoA reductase/sulfur reductase-like enzyme